MSDSDLSPKPEPEIEPGEPNPGGADATPNSDGVDTEEVDTEPLTHDLDPDENPAVEDALPDKMKQTEDTDTKATKGDGSEDSDISPEDEDPA